MQVKWEYASLDLSAHGHHLSFSHSQGDGFVAEAKNFFDRGLKEGNSNPGYLDLNYSHTSSSAVLHFLGERGWEMCAARNYVEAGGEYLFKRQVG
jgi:hypothetical protein